MPLLGDWGRVVCKSMLFGSVQTPKALGLFRGKWKQQPRWLARCGSAHAIQFRHRRPSVCLGEKGSSSRGGSRCGSAHAIQFRHRRPSVCLGGKGSSSRGGSRGLRISAQPPAPLAAATGKSRSPLSRSHHHALRLAHMTGTVANLNHWATESGPAPKRKSGPVSNRDQQPLA